MPDFHLVAVTLDEATVVRRSPAIEREREIAISDLLEANSFGPHGSDGGPYRLTLAIQEGRLLFDIRLADGEPQHRLLLSLTPFVVVIREYFVICESYYRAARDQSPSRIEALDMARRAIHDEGARLLEERLKGRIAIDAGTARRLFTLICVLHLKG